MSARFLIVAVLAALSWLTLGQLTPPSAQDRQDRIDAAATNAYRQTAQRATVRYLQVWERLDIRPREEDGIAESIRRLCAHGNTNYGAALVQEDNPFLTIEEALIVVRTSAKSYDGTHPVCRYF